MFSGSPPCVSKDLRNALRGPSRVKDVFTGQTQRDSGDDPEGLQSTRDKNQGWVSHRFQVCLRPVFRVTRGRLQKLLLRIFEKKEWYSQEATGSKWVPTVGFEALVNKKCVQKGFVKVCELCREQFS